MRSWKHVTAFSCSYGPPFPASVSRDFFDWAGSCKVTSILLALVAVTRPAYQTESAKWTNHELRWAPTGLEVARNPLIGPDGNLEVTGPISDFIFSHFTIK